MRAFILIVILSISFVQAQVTDCTKIFEERKEELRREAEQVDEARQSFEALKAASTALFERQEKAIEQKRAELEAYEQQLKEKEEAIQKQLEENRKILALIKEAKENRLVETYAKMRDNAAAQILESMDRKEAAGIFFALPPKKVSKIMAKMDPVAASEITSLLNEGPPFK
jgi:flagellar motility protein MotE (MotC chaperone)